MRELHSDTKSINYNWTLYFQTWQDLSAPFPLSVLCRAHPSTIPYREAQERPTSDK